LGGNEVNELHALALSADDGAIRPAKNAYWRGAKGNVRR